MERGGRKDLILALGLALSLHAALILGGPSYQHVPPTMPGGRVRPVIVELVAGKPRTTAARSREDASVRERRAVKETHPAPVPKDAAEPLMSEPVPVPPAEEKLPPPESPPASESPPEPREEVSRKEPVSALPPQEPDMAGETVETVTTEQGAAGQASETHVFVEARPPRYGSRTEPRYPRFAIQRGYEGTVVLRVHVLQDGRVRKVLVKESSGHAILDKAAARAVRTWRFTPAISNGKPAACWALVPVTFELN